MFEGLAEMYTNRLEIIPLESQLFAHICLEEKFETLVLLSYSGLSQFSCINTNPSMNDWI